MTTALRLALLAILATAPAMPGTATAQTAPAAGFPAATAQPPTPVPLEAAVAMVAEALFRQLPQTTEPVEIVIDPLIDGITGGETAATRDINRRVAALVEASQPGVRIVPFTPDGVARARYVFIGTFNPINNAGQPSGARDAYWICFALVDTRTHTVAARAVGRVASEGVDSQPAPAFAASPVWTLDRPTSAYIEACQRSKPGSAVSTDYMDRLALRAAQAETTQALEARRLDEARRQYEALKGQPGGEESVNLLSGLYQTQVGTGRTGEAMATFAQLVDIGLAQGRLGVMFLFEPRSTAFVAQPRTAAGLYPKWLSVIGERTLRSDRCLKVVGHASRTGGAQANLRLSAARAEAVARRLRQSAPAIAPRVSATGVGFSEVLVGLPVDDARTALDRRVEFRAQACASSKAQAAGPGRSHL